MAARKKETFSVYVIELADAACKRADCQARAAGKSHVYVGQTSKTPAERFAQHKTGGYLSATIVRKHGIRLCERLYSNWGPYRSREESLDAEARLAARLGARGYCVSGGH